MSTFEEGFAATERAADSVLQALGDVSRLARQLQRDARAGNIAAIRRGTARLEESLSLIRQQVGNASQAWPFSEEEELAYLQGQYASELQGEAQKKGLQLFERDGRLIAPPSFLRVLPGERAVRIERRQSSSIRPTKVVADIEKLQKSSPLPNAQQFLQSLYNAYIDLTGRTTEEQLKLGQVGQVVQLRRIYGLWTGRPGTSREYSQLDFARDLYSLENSGVNEVREGYRVSFPASTGARNPRGTLSFVGPDGETVLYYGIQFTGVSR